MRTNLFLKLFCLRKFKDRLQNVLDFVGSFLRFQPTCKVQLIIFKQRTAIVKQVEHDL